MKKFLLIGVVLLSSIVFLSCNSEVKYGGGGDLLPVVSINFF